VLTPEELKEIYDACRAEITEEDLQKFAQLPEDGELWEEMVDSLPDQEKAE
jgi:hypothetical protein